MSKATIKANVFQALTAVDKALAIYNAEYLPAIKALRKDCAGMSRDDARQALVVPIGEYYGVGTVVGEKRAAGQIVLDRSADRYESARKALQKVLDDVCGKADGHKPTAKAPAKLLAKMIGDVVAADITKAEFDALLKALRSGVSFK